MYLLIFSLIVCSLYLILVLVFVIGWKKTPVFVSQPTDVYRIKLSVIVACRNEESHLPKLLYALARQSYQNFELIVVNDHSTDATRRIIENAQSEFSYIKLIDATGFGKKSALREGIMSASGNLIVTTDADCIPSLLWLESIACFQTDSPCDLIICPVRFSGNSTLFSSLQTLEFASLVASGAGSAGAGMPILCNGANLAFTKDIWMSSHSDLHEEEQSGDDIFLLESVKRKGGIIRFLKSDSAFVVTEPSKSLSVFLKQRRRWASKSSSYTDWQLIYTALIVFLISFLPLLLMAVSFMHSRFWYAVLFVFVFKYVLDTFFMCSVRSFFQLQRVLFYSFLLSVLYPFYIVFVGLSVLFIKPKSWR